jgi:hypothetical protein
VRGWLTGDPVSVWDGLLCLVAAVGFLVLIFSALRK